MSSHCQRGEVPLDACIDDVRPLTLDTNQRCPGWLGKRVIRIVPAGSGCLLDLRVTGFLSRRSIDVRESDPEPAVAREQHRQVRRIDLRQLPKDVDQTAQAPGNRQVHAFPDHRLRLRARFRVAAIVQDLNQPDLRGVESLDHVQRVIVTTFVDFVALERWSNENGQHQLSLPARELGQREHRASAGSFPARANQNDDRMLVQKRFHLAPGFLQGLPGDVRIVPGSQAAGRASADEQALFRRHVRQRELVGVEEASRHRVSQACGVSAVGFRGDRKIPVEQRFDRPENVATAATGAQEKEPHLPPASRISTLIRKGTTTQRPRA